MTVATQEMLEALAANIKRELAVRHWTQTKLAEKCGWPPSRITEILQGRFDPRLGTIEKLASAFQIPTPNLLMHPPQVTQKKISEKSKKSA